MGNDHSFLRAALARLNGDWPRLRASVIVPVYNRRTILEKTLSALCAQSYPRELFEVIVADDGSHDAPEELIPQFRDALDIRIVRQEDRGFRAAAVRNLATRAATGEVIVSLDCDMLPVAAWLRAILAPFHVYEGPLCAIGYRGNVDTSALDAATIRRDVRVVERLPRVRAPQVVSLWWAPWIDWRLPIFWRSRMLRNHSVPFGLAAGGNLAYRRRDAIAAGLHDESFTHWGGEDDEFAYRLYRHGAYFVPVRRAMAYHQAHEVSVSREANRRDTHRLLGMKVPHYRHLVRDAAWERPKISVYVRAAGADAPIARAIESALRQTISDLDVCVSVDRSHTSVGDALRPYVDHPRVRILSEHFGGVAAESNAASRACRGDLILQMSPFDELVPDAAATLARALDEDSDVALAYAGFDVVDDRGGVMERCEPSGYSAYDHLHRDIMQGPRMVRARDLLRAGGWDETLTGAEDYDLTLRISERGVMRPVSTVLARRIRPDASSSDAGVREARARIDVVRRALARRGLPAGVEPFDAKHPDRIALHFDGRGLSRLRRRPRLARAWPVEV